MPTLREIAKEDKEIGVKLTIEASSVKVNFHPTAYYVTGTVQRKQKPGNGKYPKWHGKIKRGYRGCFALKTSRFSKNDEESKKYLANLLENFKQRSTVLYATNIATRSENSDQRYIQLNDQLEIDGLIDFRIAESDSAYGSDDSDNEENSNE